MHASDSPSVPYHFLVPRPCALPIDPPPFKPAADVDRSGPLWKRVQSLFLYIEGAIDGRDDKGYINTDVGLLNPNSNSHSLPLLARAYFVGLTL